MRDRKILAATPVVLAAVLALGACVDRVSGTPVAEPGAESVSTSPSVPDEDASGSPGADTESQLSPPAGDGGEVGETPHESAGTGPGGAPWDPCQVIGWEDMPDEKPAIGKQAQPIPVAPREGKDDRFNAGCQFLGRFNEIVLLWGPSSKAVVEPPDGPGEQEITVAGRTALQIISIDAQARLQCLIQVDLGEELGVVGVGTAARDQAVEGDRHPSAVAKRLAEVVIERTTG